VKVRENLDIIVEKHLHYKSINQKILKEIESVDYSESYKTNVKGKMTSFLFFPKEGQVIRDWVNALVYKDHPYLTSHGKIIHANSWIAKYDRGDYTIEHDHCPCLFSYIYYVNCPKGSSPLVFTSSGKRIKAEEGKVIIFPSIMKHDVPKNRCDDRIVLSGNVVLDTRRGL
tara:strand:- start:82 stop:594 length:513 start_codon:yes stop_codon:yes gene_type:complete